jgi:hypothetical protein
VYVIFVAFGPTPELGTKSDPNTSLNNAPEPAIVMIKNAVAKATIDHLACPQQHLLPPPFDLMYISSS